jgi:hypothetical protein
MVKYICDTCQKQFGKKTDYDRHLNRKIKCVAPIQKITPDAIMTVLDELRQKLDDLTNSNINLKKTVDDLSNSNINLKKKVESMEKELKNVNQTTINNVNVNINLIAFGNEDLSSLTDDDKKSILKVGLKGPLKYAEMVHCNKYQNIYISNHKTTSVMVYDGKKWLLKDKTYIDTVRDNGIEFMEEQYEEMKPVLPGHIVRVMDKFIDHMTSDKADDLKNVMSKDIKLLFYNNRHSINNK